jgi:hypothetical protein
LDSIDKYLETFENRPIDLARLFTSGKGKETGTIFLRTYLMGNSYRGRPKLRRLQKPAVDKPADQILKELRPKPSSSSNSTYREQSLKIHGLICAKCAREFDIKTRHLLTVHHKDGNHHNNPPDGSNWENLCTYCHDDEHSRGILGDYLRKTKEDKP